MEFNFDGILSPAESDSSYFDTYFDVATPTTTISNHSPKSSLGSLGSLAALSTSYTGQDVEVHADASDQRPAFMTSPRSKRTDPSWASGASYIDEWLQLQDTVPMVSHHFLD